MNKAFSVAAVLLFGAFWLKAQTCSQFVGGYVPSYRNPATVDYTKLSHAFYGFAGTNADGALIVEAPTVFATFKTSSVGKHRFVSLAGGAGAASFSAMTSSSVAIEHFADSCAKFCIAQEFQGIDVDWEGITTKEDSVKYGNLMRALAAALHAKDLKLVATLGYGSYGGDYYNVGALKQADWIQLMVYDQTGTWGDSPYGNHSTYRMMLDAIAYWNGRGYTDKSKIVIGLPFYGYKFNSTSGGLATAKTYSEIVASYPDLACDVDEKDLIVFNGPETIRKKVQYVLDNGLKGVMIWEMGQDISSDKSKSLLKAVSQVVCGEPAACSDVVSALPNEIVQGFYVEENPVHDLLKVKNVNSADRLIAIELIDNLGRVVKKVSDSTADDKKEVNVSELSEGIYVVRIISQHKVHVSKIVKL